MMLKHTILIADDQVINRRILGNLLQNNYNILEAENGEVALKCLHEHADLISAVLLDIVMPVMNGYEVLEAMREDPVLSKIPVIVSSQMEGDAAELHALSLGAHDFIAKPYKADIIRHRLGNTIRLRETAAMINKVERDELTGLYNKQFFLHKLAEHLNTNPNERYDLLCIGVERFKLVNDTYGTQKGDQLLCHIADVLREAGRSLNICGRFSSDIFYLLMPHKSVYTNEMFQPWIDKIKAFPIDMDIKVHCGIYEIHNRAVPVNAMCDRAQLAAEKNRGKYDVYFSCYDDAIRQKLLEEQFITSSMQSALEQKQFQVYYQPKYDLNTETVAGAEALVRWIHPEQGILSPGSFIPLFEKNGFITHLDNYVWETVCQDIRSWMDRGLPPVSVSVNVSRADIYNPKLIDILLNLVAKYQISIRCLHLEITESAYTDNPEQIITVVSKLRDLGFVVEMDDFGNGYSSLNMLAEMPVDVLKLDIRFIQNQTLKTSGKGILSFVISLAKWLNLAVVAEGVETAEQIATLRFMDCNYVQGFYYARPMPKQHFEHLLESSRVTEMVCTSTMADQYVQEPSRKKHPKLGREMLIVDDIEINRAVLAGTFDDEYDIVERADGKEAWEYLENHYQQVDIVMLDLLMPVMDGFHLLKKIRSDSRTKNLAVIITSQGDTESERRALRMQADDFISKPYTPDIIRHRVRNVVASCHLRRLEKGSGMPGMQQKISGPEIPQAEQDARTEDAVEALRPYFDIVRLVDPKRTLVYEGDADRCDMHSCFSVWGKNARCNNCTSLKALEQQGRMSKLEYSENGLYFVTSQYMPRGDAGTVLEMVSKLDEDYVDNIIDKDLLYLKLDAMNPLLERDEVTGVYNCLHVDRNLDRYIANAQKRDSNIGIALIGVENFQHSKEPLGHFPGDEVLKHIANILESNIAVSRGDFVARYREDQFLIVCRNMEPKDFAKRISAVTRLVQHTVLSDGTQVTVRLSTGCVSMLEYANCTAQELLEIAEKRLLEAQKDCSSPAGVFD
ncbi:MAG: EAL domain-containing protein [Oscillibacter sp.]|nr:EAL domain-containing protein [Oscillibacter sp.]